VHWRCALVQFYLREKGRERGGECVYPITEGGLNGCLCISMFAKRESKSFTLTLANREEKKGLVYVRYVSV